VNAPGAAPVKLRHRIAPAVGVLVVAGTLGAVGWHGYQAVMAQPFKRVVFAGDLDRLPHADLDALSRSVQAAERPTLAAVREAARRVPWVRDATVRRRFPDAVEITFEAQEAFALWNDRELVSRHGEVFAATGAGKLPRLRGPEGAAAVMVAEFPEFASALAPLASPIAELRLSPRGAWAAVLENGLTVELGRGDWKPRALRFAAAWPGLEEGARAARHADLRYPNGFALRAAAVKPTSSPTLPQGRGRTQR
jgi:cell division protein FtsQ